jgi:hypothetical protein
MKRLLLASLLCVVAVIVAPVASASAAQVVQCKFKGTTTFNPALGLVPAPGEYTFNSEAGAGTKCKVKVSSEPKVETEVEAKATVKGKGKLACTVSPGLGVAGLAAFESGSVTVGTKVFTLTKFQFTGTGPVVLFEAEGTNGTETFHGTGEANFAQSPGALLQCEAGALLSVGFEATSAGVVLP